MMDNNKENCGIAFPISLDGDGNLLLMGYEDRIRQSIRLILNTSKGERVMRPDFGVSLEEYVFSPMNAATAMLIKKELRDALSRFEPRIDIVNIDVVADPSNQGVLLINLKYRMKDTGGFDELVYPFSLEGGRNNG